MDDKKQKPPQLVWSAIKPFILKVRADAKSMLFKPGDHLDYVDLDRVTN